MDFDHMKYFKPAIILLKCFGLWPDKTASKKFKIFAVFAHLFLVEFPAFLFIVQTFKLLKNGKIQEIADCLEILMTLLQCPLKSIWFLLMLNKTKKVFEHLEELLTFSAFGKNDKRTLLQNHTKRAILLLISFYCLAYGSVCVASLMSLLNYSERKLPYETWFIIDYKHNDGLFWYLFVHQGVAGFYVSAIYSGIDGILIIFICFAVGITKELAAKIAEIQTTNDEKKAHKELCECVELHLRIKRFVDHLAGYLSFIFVLEAATNCMVLCTSTFLLTTVR
jgi:hypothetical protein